jgi:hypothetical protein
MQALTNHSFSVPRPPLFVTRRNFGAHFPARMGFPGEFALGNYGVLVFAEINHFSPEIAPALAERLKEPPTDGFRAVFIHAARASDLPNSLASFDWPRVHL